MTVIVLSSYDVRSRLQWSGIPYYFTQAICRATSNVIILSPLEPGITSGAQSRMAAAKSNGLRYVLDRDAELLKERSRLVNPILRMHRGADAIVVFHPPDAAFLDTTIPIVIVHDATWRQFTGSYPGFSKAHLGDENYRAGRDLEYLAFLNSRAIIFFTEWAASAARLEYPEMAHKIHVSLPGINLDTVPTRDEVSQFIRNRLNSQWNILHHCCPAISRTKSDWLAESIKFSCESDG
jgi:hypothetical protein